MTTFLTLDQIASSVPAAISTTHDGKRSSRYSFLPTREIIASMDAAGWGVVRTLAPNARTEARRAFGRHGLVFQSYSPTPINDPRGSGGVVHPQLLLWNSHNGSSSVRVIGGLFATICANGLVVATQSVGDIRKTHARFTAEDAYGYIRTMVGNLDNLADNIERWSSTRLSEDVRNSFARDAARIRWNHCDDGELPDSRSVLTMRRAQDRGDDLWTVYNVAQENIIRGGFERHGRRVRAVTGAHADVKINSELWSLAEKYHAAYSLN